MVGQFCWDRDDWALFCKMAASVAAVSCVPGGRTDPAFLLVPGGLAGVGLSSELHVLQHGPGLALQTEVEK